MTHTTAVAPVIAREVDWIYHTEAHGRLTVTQPYATIGDPDRLILLGLGETQSVDIAQKMQRLGVTNTAFANITMPPEIERPTSTTVEQTIMESTHAMIDDITGGDTTIEEIVGNSAGASQALAAVRWQPAFCRRLLAIAPTGLEAPKASVKKDARELLNRFNTSALDRLMVGAKGFNRFKLMKEVLAGIEYRRLYDGAAVVAELADRDGLDLTVVVGDQDPIVWADKCVEAVGNNDLTIVPDLGHISLLHETGRVDMVRVLDEFSGRAA